MSILEWCSSGVKGCVRRCEPTATVRVFARDNRVPVSVLYRGSGYHVSRALVCRLRCRCRCHRRCSATAAAAAAAAAVAAAVAGRGIVHSGAESVARAAFIDQEYRCPSWRAVSSCRSCRDDESNCRLSRYIAAAAATRETRGHAYFSRA